MKRLGSVLGVVAAAVGLSVAFSPAANASNYSSSGCTGVFAEYETHAGGAKYLKWAESRNICGGYWGHFQTAGVNDADRNPILNHRVYFNRYVAQGSCVAGTGWRNNGNGSYTNMGSTCTRIA